MIDYDDIKEQVDKIHKLIIAAKKNVDTENEESVCNFICSLLDAIYTCLNELIAEQQTEPKDDDK